MPCHGMSTRKADVAVSAHVEWTMIPSRSRVPDRSLLVSMQRDIHLKRRCEERAELRRHSTMATESRGGWAEGTGVMDIKG